MSATLPDFLRTLLSACPPAGAGVHNWLFRCARQLHAHCGESEIVELLAAASFGCGRSIPRREIEAAVANAAKCAWQPNATGINYQAAPTWPAVNQTRREAIIKDGPALADLWENSPVRVDWNGSKTEEIVDQLFPGNPLLCCGKSKSEFSTRHREEWHGQLSAMQLIVPSPMSKRFGWTKETPPKQSEHTLDNTGPRRFLVVEFDSGAFHDHAALLWHLAQFGPLALAVHSGSKSLHGWFYCQGQHEEKLHKFMRYAVSLGADRATWTRSQFVRMPDGTRENGAHQAIHYFRPEVIKP